jgi:hypothetical protein
MCNERSLRGQLISRLVGEMAGRPEGGVQAPALKVISATSLGA